MKTFTVALGVAGCIPFVFTGCSTSSNAHYIESGGKEAVVNVNKANFRDYKQAVQELAQSLVASGTLDRVAKPPALIALDLVRNETGDRTFDCEIITERIREVLLSSGKAKTMMTIGKTRDSVPLAKETADINSFTSDSTKIRTPDFTLSGRITQNYAVAGNVKESTFIFRLSLLDAKGDEVWIKSTDITKQGTRSGVGL